MQPDDSGEGAGASPELTSLRERSLLLERLIRIQRSVSHRAPLPDVLDAVVAGASELLASAVAGLRLAEPDDDEWLVLHASRGVSDAIANRVRRTPATAGVGGRAFTEQRLVVVDDYEHDPGTLTAFSRDGLQAAMAVPVHDTGRVVGSLTVATYQPGRPYGAHQQDVLLALAEHASAAIADARTLADMREAQHAKDLLLAMVSHELKTPLTVIQGTLRTVEQHGERLPRETTVDMLRSAYRRGEELSRIIDRLLQAARSELASSRERVTVSALLRDAVDGFDTSRNVSVHAMPDGHVEVDAAAVREAVGVLLENAFVHSPQDTTVAVTGMYDGATLEVAVSNTGRLPDDLDRSALFEPFRRGGNTRSRGVGLGLSIAARLAAAMDGRIDVETHDGWVTFALKVPASAVAAP